MSTFQARLVEVDWIDSSSMTDWRSFDEALAWAQGHAMIARTVGYLLHESDDRVVIAQNFGFEVSGDKPTQVDGLMIIPKISITSMKEIRRAPAKRSKRRK